MQRLPHCGSPGVCYGAERSIGKVSVHADVRYHRDHLRTLFLVGIVGIVPIDELFVTAHGRLMELIGGGTGAGQNGRDTVPPLVADSVTVLGGRVR